MDKVIRLHKPVGMSPLQLINKLREDRPELNDEKLAYAGRLDPMAEGLMLILVGSECKKRKEYERLSKEYEFEILFGISTDTYDILGKIIEVDMNIPNDVTSKFKTLIHSFIGKHTQPYPAYSSARVNGKPLFYWAREGKLDEITIPEKEVEIYDFKLLSKSSISSMELQKYIVERINKVDGEFRQTEILKLWDEFFNKNPDVMFQTIKLQVHCSSGTYVRSLVDAMGRKISVNALALSISRTQIGSRS